jgi:hypothetical protein
MGSIRRRAAIQCNAARLQRIGRLYFWTLTFVESQFDCDHVYSCWNRLRNSATQTGLLGDFRGLRVFELHPGGHGIHVHFITPTYMKVKQLRRLAQKAGFGRVHVIPWEGTPEGIAGYVGKYMAKARHESALRGRRVYGTFGMGADATRQCDIEVESSYGHIWHGVAASIPGFKDMPWEVRKGLVAAAVASWRGLEKPVPARDYAANLVQCPTLKSDSVTGTNTERLLAIEERLDARRVERQRLFEAYKNHQAAAWAAWNQKNNSLHAA